MADTSRLARMRPNRLGGGARRQAIGKQQQRPDPAPPPRSHLRAAGHHRFQLPPILGRQLQRHRSHLVL